MKLSRGPAPNRNSKCVLFREVLIYISFFLGGWGLVRVLGFGLQVFGSVLDWF